MVLWKAVETPGARWPPPAPIVYPLLFYFRIIVPQGKVVYKYKKQVLYL